MQIFETATFKKLKNKPKDNYPGWIIVHHGGGSDLDPLADTSHHTAKMIEDWHLAKGWEGLGYQYVIEKDGKVWAGRPEQYHGAHTTDYNFKSVGICLAGNFDATMPTEAQEASLTELLKDLSKKYGIAPLKIVPHRRFAHKTCFGTKLKDTWASDLLMPEPIEEMTILLVPKSRLKRIQDYLSKV